MSTLTKLAEAALANAKLIDAYVASQGLGPVSLENDVLSTLPPDLDAARNDLANTTQILKRLALGPIGTMIEILYGFTDILSLQAVVEFKIASFVPLDGSISYADIAKASNLDETLARRFIVHAMENGVFLDDSGEIKHSAISKLLATDSEALAAAGVIVAELAPASTKVLEAIHKHPDSGEPNETGYNLVNDTDLPLYSFLAKDTSRMTRFAMGMQFFSRGSGYILEKLFDIYPWEQVDVPGALFLDIGGGLGTVSKNLAKSTKHIKFIVQDLEGPVQKGKETLPEELKGRVEYMVNDFFKKQKVVGANVYFFSWIFHNWSDKYCIKILQGLVPALRKGSKVILYEYVLAEGPELKLTNKQGRNIDMVMIACCNALERTESQWKQLFIGTDKRFSFTGISQLKGSRMRIVEFEWTGN